ncbi:MAG: hydrophobic protein [Acidimicrobiales bacterium]
MLIILLLLLVLLLFGAGFALHLLWVAAVIFAVFWIIGVALGRGEAAGSHRFYRW